MIGYLNYPISVRGQAQPSIVLADQLSLNLINWEDFAEKVEGKWGK